MSRRQLLETLLGPSALLIPSGNNTAQMLAARVAGSETRFIAEIDADAHAITTCRGTHMIRKRWPLAALALIALVALISGCGSSASADSGTGSGGGGGNNSAANAQKAVKFAGCMRRNGVSEFPDPGASGNFTIDEVANGSSLDTNTPAFKQAVSACKDLEPAGFMGGKRSAEQQSAAIKFAQCIRENGVRDFPDPVNGEPLVDTNRIPSAAEPGGMSILNAAMQKCRGAAAAAGVQR